MIKCVSENYDCVLFYANTGDYRASVPGKAWWVWNGKHACGDCNSEAWYWQSGFWEFLLIWFYVSVVDYRLNAPRGIWWAWNIEQTRAGEDFLKMIVFKIVFGFVLRYSGRLASVCSMEVMVRVKRERAGVNSFEVVAEGKCNLELLLWVVLHNRARLPNCHSEEVMVRVKRETRYVSISECQWHNGSPFEDMRGVLFSKRLSNERSMRDMVSVKRRSNYKAGANFCKWYSR